VIGAGALVLAADEKTDELGGLAGTVKVDEFNDQVKDKTKGDETPVRGGLIRVRMPSDPKSLCPIIDNDETTRVAYWYMNEQLIDRDKETFEWLPFLCRYWTTRDVVVLKDGRRLEGRVVSEDDKKVVFAEGASKWTVARHEVTIDEAGSRVTWRDGFGKGDLAGKLSYWPNGRYTVTVDEKPAKTIDIAQSDIQPIEEETDGRKTTVSGVIRECVYEFKIRPGVTWHDGKPVTVEDFLFTYDVDMNPAVLDGHVKGPLLDVMDPDNKRACSKVGDDVIRYVLKKQYYAALSTVGTNWVIPAHRYGRDKFKGDDKGFGEYFNTHPEHSHPTGCSRYKFSKWEANKYVEVVRNDDWWASKPGQGVPWIDPKMPYLDKIQWITISQTAGVKALMNNEVDGDFDIEQIKWVDAETNSDEFTKRFVRAKYVQSTFTYIGWNQRRNEGDPAPIFFKDPKVRTAMTMLIDRQKILANVHYGLGEEVTGPFFSRGPFYDHSLKPLPYNPEKAKALLDEAGWIDHDGSGIRDKNGVKLEFTYNVHNARDYHLKIAEIVKQEIEVAGIKVNIKSTDFNSFNDIVNSRKFDAVRFALGDTDPLESDPYQTWHSSEWDNKGQNITGYNNPEVDDMLQKARRELDFRKRQRAFKKLHRILYEEQPYTFLFNLYDLYFYDKKFHNVKFRIIGEKPFALDEWFIPKELQGEKTPK
jgi:ABC-type transport system substrate-binding protein